MQSVGLNTLGAIEQNAAISRETPASSEKTSVESHESVVMRSPEEEDEEETYVRFVRSIFVEDDASQLMFPDEDDDQDYMPEDEPDTAADDFFGSMPDSDDEGNEEDMDAAAVETDIKASDKGSSDTEPDDDDDDDEYDADDYGERSSLAHLNRPTSNSPKLVKVKSKELRELVDGCWQALIADDGRTSSMPQVRRNKELNEEQNFFGTSTEIDPEAVGHYSDPGKLLNTDAHVKGSNTKSQENSKVTNLVKHILAGGKPSDMCIDGLPVHGVRKLVARQMAMAMQLLLHVKLAAGADTGGDDAARRGESEASRYLLELKLLRERAMKKAALIQMSVNNAIAVHKHTQDGQAAKKGASIRSFVAADGQFLDSDDEFCIGDHSYYQHNRMQPTFGRSSAAMSRTVDAAANILTDLSSPEKARWNCERTSGVQDNQQRMLTRWGTEDALQTSDIQMHESNKYTMAQPQHLKKRWGGHRNRSFIPFTVFDIPFLGQYQQMEDLVHEATSQIIQKKNNLEASNCCERETYLQVTNSHLCSLTQRLGIRYWKCLAPTSSYPLPRHVFDMMHKNNMNRISLLPAEDTLLIRGIIKLRGGVGILSITDETDISGECGDSQKLKELSSSVQLKSRNEYLQDGSNTEKDATKENGRINFDQDCTATDQDTEQSKVEINSHTSVWRRVAQEFLPFYSSEMLKRRFERMTRLSAPMKNNKFKIYQMLALDYRKRDQRWTHEEDLELLKGFQCFGFDKWPLIQLFFIQNRALNDIRRRWYAIQKLWLRTLPAHTKAKRSSSKGGAKLSLPSTELTNNMRKFLCELNDIPFESLSINDYISADSQQNRLFSESRGLGGNIDQYKTSEKNRKQHDCLLGTGTRGTVTDDSLFLKRSEGIPVPSQSRPVNNHINSEDIRSSGCFNELPYVTTTPQKVLRPADGDGLPSALPSISESILDQRTMISFSGIEDLMSPQNLSSVQLPIPAFNKGPSDFREFFANNRSIGQSGSSSGAVHGSTVESITSAPRIAEKAVQPDRISLKGNKAVDTGGNEQSRNGKNDGEHPSVFNTDSFLSFASINESQLFSPTNLKLQNETSKRINDGKNQTSVESQELHGRNYLAAHNTEISNLPAGLSNICSFSLPPPDDVKSIKSSSKDEASKGSASHSNARPFHNMQKRSCILSENTDDKVDVAIIGTEKSFNDLGTDDNNLEFCTNVFDGTSRIQSSNLISGLSCSIAAPLEPAGSSHDESSGSPLPDCNSNISHDLTNMMRLLDKSASGSLMGVKAHRHFEHISNQQQSEQPNVTTSENLHPDGARSELLKRNRASEAESNTPENGKKRKSGFFAMVMANSLNDR